FCMTHSASMVCVYATRYRRIDVTVVHASVRRPSRCIHTLPARRSSDLSMASAILLPISASPLAEMVATCLMSFRPEVGTISANGDRERTHLNSSHVSESYLGFIFEIKMTKAEVVSWMRLAL